MYFIYILYSEKSNIYYIGSTSNYLERLEQHNHSNQATFTSKHRPWVLKAAFSCGNNLADAMKIERFIKKQKSRKFIELLINSQTPLTGILAQLVRVPKLRD